MSYEFFDKTNIYFKNIEAVEQLKKTILEHHKNDLKKQNIWLSYLVIDINQEEVEKFKQVTTCYEGDQNKLVTYNIPFEYISRDNVYGFFAVPKAEWYSNDDLMRDLEEALNSESNQTYKI